MKGQKNKRKAQKEARLNRRTYVFLSLGVIVWMVLVYAATKIIRTASPVDMVKAQEVHGEKIEPVNLAPDVTSAPPPNATSAMAVLSNAVVIGAITNPAPTSFVPRAPGQAPPRPPNLLPPGAGIGDLGMRLRGVPMSADFNMLPDIVEKDGHKYLNITFAQLAAFPLKVTPEVADANDNPEKATELIREQVPLSVQTLTEKSAAVTGFMLPVHVENGLTSDFLLLRNQSGCCYGVMPRVNEWIVVHLAGKGIKPIMDVPITALGVFHVGELREDGHLVGIYALDCDQLLPPK